jgi:hypothetical protein
MSGWSKGKSPTTLYLDALRDAERITTRCRKCRRQFTGRADEGREWARAHRQDEHPELVKVKRLKKKPGRYAKRKTPA